MGRYVRTIPLCLHTRLYGIVTQEDTHLYNSRNVFQFWIRSELRIKIVDKGSSSCDCTGVVGWLRRNASVCVGKLSGEWEAIGCSERKVLLRFEMRYIVEKLQLNFLGNAGVFCAPHFILKRSEDTSCSFLNAQTNDCVLWLLNFFFFCTDVSTFC